MICPEDFSAEVIKEVQTQQKLLKDSLDSIQTQVQALSVAVVNRTPLISPAYWEESKDVKTAVRYYVDCLAPGKTRKNTLKTVINWLKEVARSPENSEKTKISTENPVYKMNLEGVSATNQLLTALGFRKHDSYWEFDDSRTTSLVTGLQFLCEELEVLSSDKTK